MTNQSNPNPYTQRATSDHRALVIYLLDISWSMGAPMDKAKNRTRLDIVMDALQQIYTEMTQRSLRQGKIRPRYRVGVIAYSDELYDIYDGFRTIDYISQQGVPALTPQRRTNTADGFLYVNQLLQEDLAKWSPEDLKYCPAPLVVHMTDGELNEVTVDPEPIVKDIKKLQVPDGNVLVQNVYITDPASINVGTEDVASWPGYQQSDDLGNPYGNKLLSMSSKLPEVYRNTINKMSTSTTLHLSPDAVMMFPGITPEFVIQAFAINGVSSLLGDDVSASDDYPDEEEVFPLPETAWD